MEMIDSHVRDPSNSINDTQFPEMSFLSHAYFDKSMCYFWLNQIVRLWNSLLFFIITGWFAAANPEHAVLAAPSAVHHPPLPVCLRHVLIWKRKIT